MYKLYTDGSQSFKYKKAGIGGYILDENEKNIDGFAIDVSKHSFTHLHETLAFIEGLQRALNLNIKKIECYMDDLGLCSILMNKNRTLKHFRRNPLLIKACRLMKQFDDCTVNHIFRHNNLIADKLSKGYMKKVIEDNNEFYNFINMLSPTETIKQHNNSHYFLASNIISKKNQPYPESLSKQFLANSNLYFLDAINKKDCYQLSFYKIENDNKILLHTQMIDSSRKNSMFIINVMKFLSEQLNKIEDKNIWLDFNKELRGESINIIGTLTDIKPIVPKRLSVMYSLAESLKKFDRVVVAVSPVRNEEELKNRIPERINIKKPKRDKTESFLLAMKILGDNLYKIGNNLDIETRFKILPEKQSDIAEIQKKYFLCYENAKLKENLNIENKDEFSNKLKKDLLEKGIKLRF